MSSAASLLPRNGGELIILQKQFVGYVGIMGMRTSRKFDELNFINPSSISIGLFPCPQTEPLAVSDSPESMVLYSTHMYGFGWMVPYP